MQSRSHSVSVCPRATSPLSGETLPLVDLIENQIDSKIQNIRLIGEGKSTAIEFLNAHFANDSRIQCLDDQFPIGSTNCDLTVYAYPDGFSSDLEVQLARWGRDDVIEFLMTRSPTRCKSVMERLSKSGDLWLGDGSPRLLSMVLDVMIESDEVLGVESAINVCIDSLDVPESQYQDFVNHCLQQHVVDSFPSMFTKAPRHHFPSDEMKILSHQTVQFVMAKRLLIQSFENKNVHRLMNSLWPPGLFGLIKPAIEQNESIEDFLNDVANQANSTATTNAMGLLTQIDPTWKPARKSHLIMDHAQLPNVRWKGIVAKDSSLVRVNLVNSNLSQANFKKSTLAYANFYSANLTESILIRVHGERANFSEATLRLVNGTNAAFNEASFHRANATGSNFTSADLTEANLSYADFSNSKLNSAKLTGADLTQTNLTNASLMHAKLNHLDMRSTALDFANLYQAAMAGCNLEGHQLTGVFLDQASLNNRSDGFQTQRCLHEVLPIRQRKTRKCRLGELRFERFAFRPLSFSHGINPVWAGGTAVLITRYENRLLYR